MNYNVVRFFSDGRRQKTILRAVTIEIAKLHCNSPLTRGRLNSGVTWFDGFRQRAKRKR